MLVSEPSRKVPDTVRVGRTRRAWMRAVVSLAACATSSANAVGRL